MPTVQIGLIKSADGWVFFPPRDGFVGASLAAYGEYSPVQRELVQAVLQPSHMAVDVGANIGGLTLPMAAHTAGVVAFEPQPFLAGLLRATLAMNNLTNKVEVVNAACGKVDGKVKITSYNDDYSQAKNFGDATVGEEGTEVPQVPLDRFTWQRLDFLKIDVEGMEKDVLEGGAHTIAKYRPLMLVEANFKDKNPPLITYLYDLDYLPYWFITPLSREENFANNPVDIFPGPVCSFDLLCIPKGSPFIFHGLTLAKADDGIWDSAPGSLVTRSLRG